jgi:predicted nucleic acid-binding protein
MTRIYWDSMLFIYLFERHPENYPRVAHLFRASLDRGDQLVTSHLAVGEVLAGSFRKSDAAAARDRAEFSQMGFQLLPFEAKAAEVFGRLRAGGSWSSADALHVATAAAAGVDLFLTADKSILRKGKVQGISFLADMHTDLF